MRPSKCNRIILSVAAGALLLAALLVVLNGTTEVVRASPGTALFVKTGGTGSQCTQATPCSLQTALAQATDGDILYLAHGIYTGAGAAVITVTQSITLYGGWDGTTTTPPVRDPDAYTTTLDGEGVRRGVVISGHVAPLLEGLVIYNGNATGLGGYNTTDAGGGVYVHYAQVVISHCTIISNGTPNGTGGGIFFWASDARLEDSLVMSNTARWGGGVRAVSQSPVFRNNRFLSNTASYGGGLYLVWTTDALVEGNLFQGNGYGNGGAIHLSGAGATVQNNLIQNNQGSTGGGIGINTGASQVVISANRIWGNTADRGGGLSIENRSVNTEVDNNIIAHNQALKGAGIYLGASAPVFRHNTLAQNNGGDGSGIFLDTNVHAVFTDTILVSHTVGITATAGSTAMLEATLWGSGAWANETDWGGGGTLLTGMVNIWDDPAFVDPGAWDYHLAGDSAAIDVGVDAGVTDDIDGDSRPIGPAPDVGADERLLYLDLPLVLRNYP